MQKGGGQIETPSTKRTPVQQDFFFLTHRKEPKNQTPAKPRVLQPTPRHQVTLPFVPEQKRLKLQSPSNYEVQLQIMQALEEVTKK